MNTFDLRTRITGHLTSWYTAFTQFAPLVVITLPLSDSLFNSQSDENPSTPSPKSQADDRAVTMASFQCELGARPLSGESAPARPARR
jgi:hypothetical protein